MMMALLDTQLLSICRHRKAKTNAKGAMVKLNGRNV